MYTGNMIFRYYRLRNQIQIYILFGVQCCRPSVRNIDTSVVSMVERGMLVIHNLSVKISKILERNVRTFKYFLLKHL